VLCKQLHKIGRAAWSREQTCIALTDHGIPISTASSVTAIYLTLCVVTSLKHSTRPEGNTELHFLSTTLRKLCQHVPTCTNMYQHVPTCTNMYQHVPACTNMYQHVPTCTSMYQHVCEFPTCNHKIEFIIRIVAQTRMPCPRPPVPRISTATLLTFKFICLISTTFSLLSYRMCNRVSWLTR
jgi:hypothetical protein